MFSPIQVCAAILLFSPQLEFFAHGHGELVHPRSRNAIDWNEVSCDENTDVCSTSATGNGCVNHTHPTKPCFNGQASFWYSQGCFIGCSKCDHESGRRQTDLCDSGKAATLPDWARSVNLKATLNSDLDIYKHNPWRAPGNAPVANACGLAGGSFSKTDGAEAGYYVETTHAHHGQMGTSLPPLDSTITWEIGGLSEVSWQVRNNHGGGYSYRLCPIEQELTEECFQNHHLDFERSKSWLLFKDGTKLPYKPLIVDEGTQPKGSQWARIPIPPTLLGPMCKPGPTDDPNAPNSCDARNDPSTECGCAPCPQTPGSDCSRCDNCHQPSFPPLYKENNTIPIQGISPVVGIVDTLRIPSDLKPGKYVLGWRYDCEATAQVWSNCADVTLVVSSNITTTTTTASTTISSKTTRMIRGQTTILEE